MAIVLAAALWGWHRWGLATGWGWLLVVTAAAWALYAMVLELSRLWRVGVVGADVTIRDGLGYSASLRLVHSELSFLGTGAHKLTGLPEFGDALRRCRSDVPIRLLLRRPDDPALVAAARRADRQEAAYKNNVIESLRRIKALQESIGNVEVRFYDGDLVFRVMLVDRTMALVSYNDYGRGDGSELPQLHLLGHLDARAGQSFFSAFEYYFNERWQDATHQQWDFAMYL
jgi:hypothetical protein